MSDRRLLMAALDPNAAISASMALPAPTPVVFAPVEETAAYHELTLSVEVEPPKPISRWRFFLFWLLIRLAARVYPFNFEIHRTPR